MEVIAAKKSGTWKLSRKLTLISPLQRCYDVNLNQQ